MQVRSGGGVELKFLVECSQCGKIRACKWTGIAELSPDSANPDEWWCEECLARELCDQCGGLIMDCIIVHYQDKVYHDFCFEHLLEGSHFECEMLDCPNLAMKMLKVSNHIYVYCKKHFAEEKQ